LRSASQGRLGAIDVFLIFESEDAAAIEDQPISHECQTYAEQDLHQNEPPGAIFS
jgi:hypothetical protein